MAEIKSVDQLIQDVSSYYKKKGGPESNHDLLYESFTETVEPVYYFLLDLLGSFGYKVEKLVDNFSLPPGSPHAQELGQRKGIMQQQASKLLGDTNTVLRSILNLIYDLREFRIRLDHYEGLKSKDSSMRNAALLSLKQIWMDKVDFQKGNSSLKGLATTQAGFVTVIDAFLASEDVKSAEKLDLNDRVKRIVISRVQEFETWLSQSEAELRKRYEIERNYLKSQVNSLKLYSRWVKPYLRMSEELESKHLGRDPNIVNIFNRTVFEVVLLGKSSVDPAGEAASGNMPMDFAKMKFKRKYNKCVLLSFRFVGLPGQGAYVGKTEVNFKAYALNDDELKKLDEELNKSDLGDVLRLIEGSTTESLDQLQKDIDYFLGEDKEQEKKKKEVKDDSNPFKALIGGYDKTEDKKEDKKKDGKIREDDWIEKNYLRKNAAEGATDSLYAIFDTYKKAHGMVSFT